MPFLKTHGPVLNSSRWQQIYINIKQLQHSKLKSLVGSFKSFFVTFFISDKGRKFFKFFRQLMIKGETINKIQIPRKLKEAFFILNIAIEAAQNHILSDLAYNFNTNLLIKKIHNIINHNKNFGHHVPDVNESGNPLDYYLTIINYLNANILR